MNSSLGLTEVINNSVSQHLVRVHLACGGEASSQMASDAGNIIGLTLIHMIASVNNNNHHKESSHLTYEGTRMKQKEKKKRI